MPSLKDLKKRREELDQKIRMAQGKKNGKFKSFAKKAFSKQRLKKVGSRLSQGMDQAAHDFWG